MTQKQCTKILTDMVRNKEINYRNKSLYRFLFGLFNLGNNFKKVNRWSYYPKNATYWYRNLKRAGYIKRNDEKIYVDEEWDECSGICLHLMAGYARGLLDRK